MCVPGILETLTDISIWPDIWVLVLELRNGKYTPKLSVFERLAEENIFDVEETETFFEYFLVWDIDL